MVFKLAQVSSSLPDMILVKFNLLRFNWSKKTTICLCLAVNLLNLTLSALNDQQYFSECCNNQWVFFHQKILPTLSLQNIQRKHFQFQWIFSHLKSDFYIFECLFILISLLVVFFSHFSYSEIYFNYSESRLIQHIENYWFFNFIGQTVRVWVLFDVISEKHCA